MRLLIRNGRVVDPQHDQDRITNLLIEDGRIARWDAGHDEPADEVLDAEDQIVLPGLIDTYAELREPGWEEDETIVSGTRSALVGGFTSVACVPCTDPPVDTQAGVQFILQRAAAAKHCRVYVVACASKNRDGKELSEMGSLVEAGAVAFSDASRSIQNSELMRRALQYSLMFGKPIINYPDVEELSREGIMHEGPTALVLGLAPIAPEAEDVMTGRDLRLAEATGGRLHLAGISTSGSVDLIRRFKSRGVPITAGIHAINFALEDIELRSFEARFKVRPPLRSTEHVAACVAGLSDDTLDIIASGHAPRAAEKTNRELDQVPFGMCSFETVLGLVVTYLVRPQHLSWSQVARKLSLNPARLLGLELGQLAPGATADITIVDPNHVWTVDPGQFASKSKNTPLAGRELFGRAVATIVGGQVRYRLA